MEGPKLSLSWRLIQVHTPLDENPHCLCNFISFNRDLLHNLVIATRFLHLQYARSASVWYGFASVYDTPIDDRLLLWTLYHFLEAFGFFFFSLNKIAWSQLSDFREKKNDHNRDNPRLIIIVSWPNTRHYMKERYTLPLCKSMPKSLHNNASVPKVQTWESVRSSTHSPLKSVKSLGQTWSLLLTHDYR